MQRKVHNKNKKNKKKTAGQYKNTTKTEKLTKGCPTHKKKWSRRLEKMKSKEGRAIRG